MSWDERRNARLKPVERVEHLKTFFDVKEANGRVIRCALYKVLNGYELRLVRENSDEILRSQRFPLRHDEAVATLADEWHLAMRRTVSFPSETAAPDRAGYRIRALYAAEAPHTAEEFQYALQLYPHLTTRLPNGHVWFVGCLCDTCLGKGRTPG